MSQMPYDDPDDVDDPVETAEVPQLIPADNTAAIGALQDLEIQGSTIRQILDVIDEAGHAITRGQPSWVDPDVFGTSVKGRRLARHTAGAQSRVLEAFNLSRVALTEHYVALADFEQQIDQVEADTTAQLDEARRRVEEVTS